MSAKKSRGLSAPMKTSAPVKFSAPRKQPSTHSTIVNLPPPPRYSEDTIKQSSDSSSTIEQGPSWISAVHTVEISTSLAPASYKSCASSTAETDSINSRLEPRISRSRPQQHQRMASLRDAASMFRFAGGSDAPTAWGKLKKDDEIYDESGDTLVRFRKDLPPSFRVKSSEIESLASPYLNTLLREGFQSREGYRARASASASNASSKGPPSSTRSRSKWFGLRKKSSTVNLRPVEDDEENPHSYEIEFAGPRTGSVTDITRYHITTRNLFAFLADKPLVGLSFYQALVDLHERLEMYLPETKDPVEIMIRYLVRNGFDDVHGDPRMAAGLLAWSERDSVRWSEGWREAFVQCVGMYDRLKALPEMDDITPRSKEVMAERFADVETRLALAEKRLSDFNFKQMWPVRSAAAPTAQESFEHFADYLKHLYMMKAEDKWPPRGPKKDGSGWLTRKMVMNLEDDFASAYNFIVDREVTWANSKKTTAPRQIVCVPRGPKWRADFVDLQVTDLLLAFDKTNGYPNIPHPYPLLPAEVKVYKQSDPSFGANWPEAQKLHHQAYATAFNPDHRNVDSGNQSIVSALKDFQSRDLVGSVNPRDQRLGCWILLYGILQTLASVSASDPRIRHGDDALHHINASTKGLPHWSDGDEVLKENNHNSTFCWYTIKYWPKKQEEQVFPESDTEDVDAEEPLILGPRGVKRGAALVPKKKQKDQQRRNNYQPPPEW